MSEAKENHFCWNELMTTDSKKAKNFYEALLDWESYDIDMGEVIYTIFKKGDADVCGMMQMSKELQTEVPSHWMSYIHVDDVVSMTEKAESLGATILLPLKEVPGYGMFSVIQDVTGATFAFWQKTAL